MSGFMPNPTDIYNKVNNQQNPWGDIYGQAAGQNRYGEQVWTDPYGRFGGDDDLGASMRMNLYNNPRDWLAAGLGGTGMRLNDRLGIHIRNLNQHVAGGLPLLYEQLGGGAVGAGENMVQWASDRSGGGANWLGAEAGQNLLGGLFGGSGGAQLDATVQTAIEQISPQAAQATMDLIEAIAWSSLSPGRRQAMMANIEDKAQDWWRMVTTTGEEMPFYEYIRTTGVLEHFGM